MAKWTQQQVEQWIAEHGGKDAVTYDEVSQNIPNPLRVISNPDYDPTAPATISVQRQVWTNTKTGAKLTAEPSSEGGSYEIVGNEGADPNKSPGSTTTASGADPEELRRQRERNQAAGAGYYTDAEISQGLVAGQTKKEAEDKAAAAKTEADKNRWTEVKRDTVKNEKTGQSEVQITEQNGLGETRTRTASETTVAKPDKPTLVPLPGGGQGQLVDSGRKDEGGNTIWEAKPVEGTQPTPSPDIGPLGQTLFGQYAQRLAERAQQRQALVNASNGTYTQEQMKKDLDGDQQLLQAQLNQDIAILNGQNNVRQQDITQAGQQLTAGANRQSFASTASSNALSMLQKFPQIAQAAGSGERLQGALTSLMNLPADFAKSLPGGAEAAFPTATNIPHTAAQNQLMGTPLGGGQPITINIGTPAGGAQSDLGGMPQSMSGVTDPAALTPVGAPASPSQIIDMYHDPKDQEWNTALEQIKAEITQPPGGAQTVGPHQRFAGGQLRAPGAGPVGAGAVSSGPVGTVG